MKAVKDNGSLGAGLTAHSDLSDERLARLAANGDGSAFAVLYDRYGDRISKFCYRLTSSWEDAADATQQTFLNTFEWLQKEGGDSTRLDCFAAYLFAVARNASYRILKRRKKVEPTDLIPESRTALDGTFDPGDLAIDPERAAMLSIQKDEIRTANASLPERQREALALREVAGLSYDEIAETLQMKPNAVAQLILRARVNLRNGLRTRALDSVAPATQECERALPLLAMRQDGQLAEGEDSLWLQEHLEDCDTCRVSQASMEEVGVSYRAIAVPVAVAALLRDSVAKAAELTAKGVTASAGGKISAIRSTLGSGKGLGLTWAVTVSAVVALVVAGGGLSPSADPDGPGGRLVLADSSSGSLDSSSGAASAELDRGDNGLSLSNGTEEGRSGRKQSGSPTPSQADSQEQEDSGSLSLSVGESVTRPTSPSSKSDGNNQNSPSRAGGRQPGGKVRSVSKNSPRKAPAPSSGPAVTPSAPASSEPAQTPQQTAVAVAEAPSQPSGSSGSGESSETRETQSAPASTTEPPAQTRPTSTSINSSETGSGSTSRSGETRSGETRTSRIP